MALLKVWGEECYGASDGASSLPIRLPLQFMLGLLPEL